MDVREGVAVAVNVLEGVIVGVREGVTVAVVAANLLEGVIVDVREGVTVAVGLGVCEDVTVAITDEVRDGGVVAVGV